MDASPAEYALARAVVYRLLATLWRQPVPPWRQELDEQLPAAEVALELCGLPKVVDRIAERTAATSATQDALVEEYGRRIGHTVHAAATPYETEWTGWAGQVQQFHQLSDIAAFYLAFGLEPDSHCHERADHLSVELEFLRFLALKEAYGLEQGDEQLADVAVAGQRSFLQDHLASWAPAFTRIFRDEKDESLYALAALLLDELLRHECERLEVETGDPELALPSAGPLPDSSCFSCIHSSGCASGATAGA